MWIQSSGFRCNVCNIAQKRHSSPVCGGKVTPPFFFFFLTKALLKNHAPNMSLCTSFPKPCLFACINCTSLTNLLSPKDIQNFYWLCLQQHLILADFQEPFRLLLRSTENNYTQAGCTHLAVVGNDRKLTIYSQKRLNMLFSVFSENV